MDRMDTNSRSQKWERASAPPEGDWRNMIRDSTHEDEVIQLVRDHMARWSPEEIVRLPEDCRPGRVRDGEDISQWAFRLASTHCAGAVDREDEVLLDRMLEFITQAAVRVAELKACAEAKASAELKASS
jgi:hypothetical protein